MDMGVADGRVRAMVPDTARTIGALANRAGRRAGCDLRRPVGLTIAGGAALERSGIVLADGRRNRRSCTSNLHLDTGIFGNDNSEG